MISVFALDAGCADFQQLTLEELPGHLGAPGAKAWVDLEGEDVARIQDLAKVFEFHPLAVEDTLDQLHLSQAKVDDFGSHLFIVLHSARWDMGSPEPVTRELDIFLGSNFLITVHEEPMRAVTGARELCARRSEILGRGPAHLLHSVVDHIVDNLLPVSDLLAERIDRLEEEIFGGDGREVIQHALELKRGLLKLRRMVGPERDAMLSLTRAEFDLIGPEERPYFRDVYDRISRVSELFESYRDEVSTLLEAHLSLVSNRLNEVMKVLTIFSAVMLPLGVIVGYFGMNLPLMEFKLPHAQSLVLVLMLLTGGAVFWYVKSRRWL